MRNTTLLFCAAITSSLFFACKSTTPPERVEQPAPATGGIACVPPPNVSHPPITVRNVVGRIGSVERLDPALDQLLDKDVSIQKLAEGFDWSEGPVWMGDHLLFSDVPMNMVFRWDEHSGIAIAFQPSGYTGKTPRGGEPGSNGLARDREGRLILCQHGDRRVVRREKDGRFVTIADQHRSRRLNSPNDVVVKSNGDIYFTDPPYGLVKNVDDPAKELPFQGVYRWSASDARVTLLTSELSRPNGLAFSPDEKTLYVANSDPTNAVWMTFPVNGDGTLGKGRVFFNATAMTRGKKGLPDGMKVDVRGNLWATGPGGVFILSPQGKHLGTLATGEATGNCAWGDDGSTLYINADMYLCRVRTKTKGAGW
jgi:gluconolactonase